MFLLVLFGKGRGNSVDLLPAGVGDANLILQISKNSSSGTIGTYMTRTSDALI